MSLVNDIKDIKWNDDAEKIHQRISNRTDNFNQVDEYSGDTPLIAALRLPSVDSETYQAQSQNEGNNIVWDGTKYKIVTGLLEPEFSYLTYIPYFMSEKAKPNKANENTGEFPLEIAAKLDFIEMPVHYGVYGEKEMTFVSILIEYGANPEQVNKKTLIYPLYISVARKRYFDTQLLLESYASPDLFYEGKLIEPIKNGIDSYSLPGHEEDFPPMGSPIYKEYYEKSEPYYAMKMIRPTRGGFPLIIAVRNNDFEIVELLVRYGADRNRIETMTGSFPLLEAAFGGNLDIVEILLDNTIVPAREAIPHKPPSSPKMRNYLTGYFPLTAALEKKHYVIALLLIEKDGMTPSHLVTEKIFEAKKEFLLLMKNQTIFEIDEKTQISELEMERLEKKLEEIIFISMRKDPQINSLISNLKNEKDRIFKADADITRAQSGNANFINEVHLQFPHLLGKIKEFKSKTDIDMLEQNSPKFIEYYKKQTILFGEWVDSTISYYKILTQLYKILIQGIQYIPREVGKVVSGVEILREVGQKNTLLRVEINSLLSEIKNLEVGQMKHKDIQSPHNSKQRLTQMIFPTEKNALDSSRISILNTYASLLNSVENKNDKRLEEVQKLISEVLKVWVDDID